MAMPNEPSATPRLKRMQKDQPIAIAPDTHLKAGQARQMIDHLDQIVIMRGEHPATLRHSVEVFDNRFGDGHPVVCCRPAPHLIEHN
jgi:hypothetical protein